MVVADIDGDGRDDLLYRKVVSQERVYPKDAHNWQAVMLKWFYRLSTGDNFGPEQEAGFPNDGIVISPLPSSTNLYTPRPLDIDGDGAGSRLRSLSRMLHIRRTLLGRPTAKNTQPFGGPTSSPNW